MNNENNPIPKTANNFAYKLYVPANQNTILLITNNNNANNKTIPNVLPSFIPKDNNPNAKTMIDIKNPITENITAFNISKPYNFSQKLSINPIYAENIENTMNRAHEGIGIFIMNINTNKGKNPIKLYL